MWGTNIRRLSKEEKEVIRREKEKENEYFSYVTARSKGGAKNKGG